MKKINEEEELVPKKKRQSGKRKPKVNPVPPIVEQIVQSPVPETVEESDYEKPSGQVEVMPMSEVYMQPAKQEPELSRGAQGWKAWLQLQGQTPEQFLERYPNHKFKHQVEEIIAFEAER